MSSKHEDKAAVAGGASQEVAIRRFKRIRPKKKMSFSKGNLEYAGDEGRGGIAPAGPGVYEGRGTGHLGAAVFSGMLCATLFGIFLTPVFFYVVRKLSSRLTSPSAATRT